MSVRSAAELLPGPFDDLTIKDVQAIIDAVTQRRLSSSSGRDSWTTTGSPSSAVTSPGPVEIFKTAPFDRSGTPPCRLFKPIRGLVGLELVRLRMFDRFAHCDAD